MRVLGMILLAIVVQAGLEAFLPQAWPPPDLWFLVVIFLGARMPAWGALLLGFGVGLAQDLAVGGTWGIHALGLTMAAFVGSELVRLLPWEETMGRYAILMASFLAKWAGVALILVWLAVEISPQFLFFQVFLPELLLTAIMVPPFSLIAGQIKRQANRAAIYE